MNTTPTTAPPAWLETAAKLDAPTADRVPIGAKIEVTPVEKPRSRLSAPPAALAPATQAREETDLGWHGYDAGALLPSTLALGLLTAGMLLGLRPLAPAAFVVETIYAPLAALWAGQVFRMTYRLMAYHYRLTNRRLFRERGRLYPHEEPLDLARVARVEVKQSLLGVGTVCIVPEEASGRAVVELAGVRRPRALATAIEQAALAAREGNITAVRVKSIPS